LASLVEWGLNLGRRETLLVGRAIQPIQENGLAGNLSVLAAASLGRRSSTRSISTAAMEQQNDSIKIRRSQFAQTLSISHPVDKSAEILSDLTSYLFSLL